MPSSEGKTAHPFCKSTMRKGTPHLPWREAAQFDSWIKLLVVRVIASAQIYPGVIKQELQWTRTDRRERRPLADGIRRLGAAPATCQGASSPQRFVIEPVLTLEYP